MNRLMILLVLATGLGAGFVVGQMSPPENSGEPWRDRTSKSASESGDSNADSGDDPEAADGKPAKASLGSGSNETTASNGADSGATISGIAADMSVRLAPLEREPIPGTISGSVVSWLGVPLEGVSVRIVNQRASDPPDHPDEVDLQTFAEQSARRHLTLDQREAETSEDGTFEFGDLSSRSYSVSFEAEGWVFTPERRTLRPGQRFDAIARRERSVRCIVTTVEGSAPEKATIEFKYSDGREFTRNWTPSEPTIAFPAQRLDVLARTDDEKSEPLSIDLSGDGVDTLTLAMKGRSGVRGRITVPADEGVETVWVRVRPLVDGEEPVFDQTHEQVLQRTNAIDRNGDGRMEFSLLDLQPGRTLVGLGRAWRRSDHVQVIDVPDGAIADLDFDLPPLDASSAIFVAVLDASGEPVLRNVEFKVELESSSFSMTTSADSLRIGKRFALLPDDEVWKGITESSTTVKLTVTHPSHGRKTVVLESPEATVRLSEASSLTVSLVGVTSPDLDIEVAIAELDANRWSQTRGSTQDSRLFEFKDVEPNDWELRIDIGDIRVLTETISLAPGPNNFDFDVPPLAKLQVRFPEVSESAQVSLKRVGGTADLFDNNRSISKDGDLVDFGEIPVGDYRLIRLAGMTMDYMEVSLPASGVIEYQPRKVNAFRIDQSSENTEAAGLEVGDLIFGINDLRFDNLAQVQLALAAAAGQPEVEMHVVRNGREIVLDMKGSDLQKLGRNSSAVLPDHYEPKD